MEIDTNINDTLREVITFLECLREAQLPLTLESLREKLLIRSKNTLRVTTRVLSRTSSPEPYLEMKSGPRSLLLMRSEVLDSEEYIGMEKSQEQNTKIHQDYYETFEKNKSANEHPAEQNNGRDAEGQMLIGIYKNLSAMQARSKCYKCGPLHRKEGKKLFLSESACWIALVGSHLLIYRNERHNRPYAIYPIRGYMARPAPSIVPRDRRKSESAFEMYSPGNETLRFIARTRKDMEQWIAKICEVGCNRNEGNGVGGDEKKGHAVVESSLVDCHEGDEATRQNRDAPEEPTDKSTAKAESKSVNNDRNNEVGTRRKDTRSHTGERAPPLPARIPRRLPSLPRANDSYRTTVEENDDHDDDDDDIYHRIEDLKNETCYQNMILSRKLQATDATDATDEKEAEAVAYDDVRAPNVRERSERVEKTREERTVEEIEDNSTRDATSLEETYDDIVALSRINPPNIEPDQNRNTSVIAAEEGEEFYDDVENLIPNRRFAKDHIKDQIEVSSKLQKKSFLNRVLSRRESLSAGKSDKRHRKVSSNPPSSSDTEGIPTYDDVSDLTANQQFLADGGEELPEYNCPPPPRPIHQVKLPARSQSPDEIEEFYDDVSTHQERCNKSHQPVILPGLDTFCAKGTYNAESMTNGDCIRGEMEHYELPKTDSRICDIKGMEQNEQLYDDIALLADFTARQRDIAGRRENEDAKSVSSDKRAWNRFGVNRKSRVTSDFSCSAETNKRSGNEREREGTDDIEDSSETNGTVKRNTFQKLISRMENSLAKVSARGSSSPSTTGKPNASSNSS